MNTFHPPQIRQLCRKNRFNWIAAALASAVLLGLISAGSAQASGSSFYFGKWFVTLTFPNNEPLVELTTEIWHKPAGSAAYLFISQVDALECTTTGNLQIANEMATFSGQEYIACEQPDMAQQFSDVSQGLLGNVPDELPVRQPFVEGQMVLAPGVPANQTLPTFYHPGLQHGLQAAGAGNVSQILKVDHALATSSPFSQSSPFGLRAEFQIQPNGSYQTLFTANGVTTPGSPAIIGSSLWMNLDATTLYFGYSPPNNRYFQGTIKTLTMDPGAFGRD